MKRYDMQYRPDWAYNQASMMPSKDGRYVEYTDIQSLQVELDRYKNALINIVNDFAIGAPDQSDGYCYANIARKALEGGTP